MTKATGYSLFLVPNSSSAIYGELHTIIVTLAKEHEGPVFVPHVTLIGGMCEDESSICQKTEELAHQSQPFTIQMGDLGSNSIFFQILFSIVAHSAELMNLNKRAQSIFHMNTNKYFPHLSLAYGDYSEEQVNEMMRRVDAQHPTLIEASFTVETIEVWSTEGEVKDWFKVRTFSMLGA